MRKIKDLKHRNLKDRDALWNASGLL